MLDDSREAERQETLDELADLLAVVQEMGQRLASETHGDPHAAVREFNGLLHQARRQLGLIRTEAGLDP